MIRIKPKTLFSFFGLFICVVSIGGAFASFEYAKGATSINNSNNVAFDIKSWWDYAGIIEGDEGNEEGTNHAELIENLIDGVNGLNDKESTGLTTSIAIREAIGQSTISNVAGLTGDWVDSLFSENTSNTSFLIDFSNDTNYYIYSVSNDLLDKANIGDYVFTYKTTVVYNSTTELWETKLIEPGYSLVGYYTYNFIGREKCITTTWKSEADYNS